MATITIEIDFDEPSDDVNVTVLALELERAASERGLAVHGFAIRRREVCEVCGRMRETEPTDMGNGKLQELCQQDRARYAVRHVEEPDSDRVYWAVIFRRHSQTGEPRYVTVFESLTREQQDALSLTANTAEAWDEKLLYELGRVDEDGGLPNLRQWKATATALAARKAKAAAR